MPPKVRDCIRDAERLRQKAHVYNALCSRLMGKMPLHYPNGEVDDAVLFGVTEHLLRKAKEAERQANALLKLRVLPPSVD
jgi:hypothetical protein